MRQISTLLAAALIFIAGCSDSAKNTGTAPQSQTLPPSSASQADSEAEDAAEIQAVPKDSQNIDADKNDADSIHVPAPSDPAGRLPNNAKQQNNQIKAEDSAEQRAQVPSEADSSAQIQPDAAEAADSTEPTDSGTETSADDADIHSYDPLSRAQRYVMESIQWDLPPEVLNAVLKKNEGGHFLHSDERHPELFRESIENLGNSYIGIGTDQGYVFIGWQRPTLAFLVDYDPWAVMIHRIYIALFKECADSACLHAHFEDKQKGRDFIKNNPDLSSREIVSVYNEGQRGIAYRLRQIKSMSQKTFMNDPETFNYIKKMIDDGRLVTLQANLLGDKAFAAMASALQTLGTKVGVLYLSNAEQYWRYSDQFRANMRSLTYADNAVIIRTQATKPVNSDYRYSVQKADLFLRWLSVPSVKAVKDIVGYSRNKDPEVFPLTFEEKLPPEAAE